RLLADARSPAGDVRQARQQVVPDVRWIREVLAGGAGVQQRGRLVPVLVRRVDVEDLGTRAAGETATQPAVGLPGDRVGHDVPGEGEPDLRVQPVAMLANRATRLRETMIERSPARPGQEIQQPVEDDGAVLVLVEAEMDEVAQEAGGLREPEAVRELHAAR